MSGTAFIEEIESIIAERSKMTSPLYQTILGGKATKRLLQTFVIQRWPIKSWWTRNLMGVAHRVDDLDLRLSFIENAYEEETGGLTNSKRHVETFEDFGRSVGVDPATLPEVELFPETVAVIEHNKNACNNTNVHFTVGATSVLMLMEGQPPITNDAGHSMMAVMRDVYKLPTWGYEFFVHHASGDADQDGVSELEDEHTEPLRQLLLRYCDTPKRQQDAKDSLRQAIELRHRHFDAVLRAGYDPSEPVFVYED
ncbi:pyrroloquinoline quinone biosynthesis protein PqqC [Streptomyces sp. CB03234]|jgi:pyrroloquinoline-quinone synthase|uniref:TenA family transcriptional regulator n=1 Tax=Streptomyces sp. (strain CB03234) TaxID=1703937 RepID=UPI00093F4EDB|nr:iron-containing redox enzyme family protein [Streptomyces sp. CB03234]OKJ99661.1 pyrroloquinoline quinone biosynthesis protein PqqC [Streptomyces sp. CB03234]